MMWERPPSGRPASEASAESPERTLPLEPLRPSPRAMQHGENLNGFALHPISHQERRPRHNQFEASFNPPGPSHLRKPLKPLHRGHDPIDRVPCCFRILRLQVTVRRSQIFHRALGPAQLHRRQPAIIFFTLSWSTSLPASACRIPLSICSICQRCASR